MSDIGFLIASYDDWWRERQELSERDCSPEDMPSSSQWQDSDDSAVELMHQMATELRKRAPGYWTVEEIAEAMRVSKMTVYRLCAAGELPAVKFGRSFRIAEADFQDYLTKNITGRL